ncbi:diguanylate cyclase (GGDEF)-like protein [Ochrobactrum sp. 19YEA23]|uniref:GGDEF domain-containing protein n=1 Tax=Ochrobactrum sp. 19YEA23 TaxID=3039854 RepID=UPI002478E857|nr:diguanylate cyclase (GGDEF)-like protein [Ochrobactrum sp. 19YEA23]
MVWFLVKIVPSLLIMLFAVAMTSLWVLDRRRKHMLLFGLSFAAFSLGHFVQVSPPLPNLRQTFLLAILLQLGAGWLFCQAVMVRLGREFPPVPASLITVSTLAAVGLLSWQGAIYSYLVVAANVGLGTLAAVLCLHARRVPGDRWIETALRLVLALLAAHFFLRSIFTIVMLDDVVSSGELLSLPYWSWVTVAASMGGVLLGLFILTVAALDIIDKLRNERDADPLTGLLNRRGMERHARRKLANAAQGATHGVIIADIDHFKAINDELGHATGDRVLVEFSHLLQSLAGQDVIVSRVGGEEFVLLVAGSAQHCERFAKRLCNQVGRHAFAALPSDRHVTCSFGIAMLRHDETLWQTVSRADLALMRGKHRGRNRTVTEGDEFPELSGDAPATFRLTG